MEAISPNQLTLFAEATPASLSHVPGRDRAKQMTVISGLKCLDLYEKSGPIGSLQRMLLGMSTWASTVCFLTWKVKATKQQHLLFQLAPSTPRTEEIGSGLLRTPDCSDAGRGDYKDVEKLKKRHADGHQVRLAEQITLLPTPRANKHSPAQQAGLYAESGIQGGDVADTSSTGPQGRSIENLRGKGRGEEGGFSCGEGGNTWTRSWIEVATEFCGMDDGLPRKLDRNKRLKALGNSVVPQIPEIIGRAIMEAEWK